MKSHKTVMIVLAAAAVLLIVLAPTLNVGMGFGLLFLICPLMMLAMMYMMGNNHK